METSSKKKIKENALRGIQQQHLTKQKSLKTVFPQLLFSKKLSQPSGKNYKHLWTRPGVQQHADVCPSQVRPTWDMKWRNWLWERQLFFFFLHLADTLQDCHLPRAGTQSEKKPRSSTRKGAQNLSSMRKEPHTHAGVRRYVLRTTGGSKACHLPFSCHLPHWDGRTERWPPSATRRALTRDRRRRAAIRRSPAAAARRPSGEGGPARPPARRGKQRRRAGERPLRPKLSDSCLRATWAPPAAWGSQRDPGPARLPRGASGSTRRRRRSDSSLSAASRCLGGRRAARRRPPAARSSPALPFPLPEGKTPFRVAPCLQLLSVRYGVGDSVTRDFRGGLRGRAGRPLAPPAER